MGTSPLSIYMKSKREISIHWYVLFFSFPLFVDEEILPGRPVPPECHAELHTDYDGAAVRWGLTHHKESAADCCQACLDQAKRAKPGRKKCNIWVYCPSEMGCHSPDIYKHKNQECWLKYVRIDSRSLSGTIISFSCNLGPNKNWHLNLS